MPAPQPLIIHPGTNQFVRPASTRNGSIRLTNSQQIELYCSGAGFAAPFSSQRNLQATCRGNNEFLVAGRVVAFNALRCVDQVAHVARVSHTPTVRPCPFNVTHIEIGFAVDARRFLWTMYNCFDPVLESTLFTFHRQAPEDVGYQRSMVRPQFTGGTFFGGRNVDRLYTGFIQRQTIGGIIGTSRVAQLWDDQRDFFLARGHLASRSDFLFEPEQRTSFYLMNAAPQWHSFNSGNWERIETSVQQFLAWRNINAQVYSGTWGIQRLADERGIQREIFLDFAPNGRGRIPVPMFYYKIVVGERSGRGVAFVGVNNPHATMAEVNSGLYRLCTDVSNQITYVNWERFNLTMGYSYACDVNEFARVVTHLPASLRTTGLLV